MVIVGRQTWTLNTGHPAFHALPELKGESLHIPIHVCASVHTRTRVHVHTHRSLLLLLQRMKILSETFSKNIERTAIYVAFH